MSTSSWVTVTGASIGRRVSSNTMGRHELGDGGNGGDALRVFLVEHFARALVGHEGRIRPKGQRVGSSPTPGPACSPPTLTIRG